MDIATMLRSNNASSIRHFYNYYGPVNVTIGVHRPQVDFYGAIAQRLAYVSKDGLSLALLKTTEGLSGAYKKALAEMPVDRFYKCYGPVNVTLNLTDAQQLDLDGPAPQFPTNMLKDGLSLASKEGLPDAYKKELAEPGDHIHNYYEPLDVMLYVNPQDCDLYVKGAGGMHLKEVIYAWANKISRNFFPSMK